MVRAGTVRCVERFVYRKAETCFQRGFISKPKDNATIDGLVSVRHDFGYEPNKFELDRMANEVPESLARILAQPGIQHGLNFGDQSTNGSLFVDRSGKEDVLDVRREERNHLRGNTPVRGWDGIEASPRFDARKRFSLRGFLSYWIRPAFLNISRSC